MSINLLGKEALKGFDYDIDTDRLDIPIHAFDVIIADECHRGYSAKETGTWKYVLDYLDAVKIGLTATPATHSLAMFRNKVFSYSTEQAVLDGYLVDYDAVKISSDIHIKGAFLKAGELVGEIDTETGAEKLDELEDEREFAASEIEKQITSPDSTRKIITALKKYTDLHEKEYQRFPKTLIFAVNDLPHTSHADEVVRTCKEIFAKSVPTENTWVYDCRTTIPGVTKKELPLVPQMFTEFEKCYGNDPNGQSKRKGNAPHRRTAKD